MKILEEQGDYFTTIHNLVMTIPYLTIGVPNKDVNQLLLHNKGRFSQQYKLCKRSITINEYYHAFVNRGILSKLVRSLSKL